MVDTPQEMPAAAQSFLVKVQQAANLTDLYDARDIAEVVFRTMRDLMTTEAADRVASELEGEAASLKANKSLQGDLVALWKDTNPIVAFLSRVRGPLEFDDETFLFRISQEGGLQRGIQPETAVSAVFAATKSELTSDRIEEVASALPGRIRQLWQQA